MCAAAVLITGLAAPTDAFGSPAGGGSVPSQTYTFVSAPSLHPPRLQALVRKPGLAPGDFLVATAPVTTGGQPDPTGGPLILDSDARPVWFSPIQGQAADLQQQTYAGQRVLVCYEQPNLAASGQWVIVNDQYRQIATLTAQAPWQPDAHDAWISGGNLWMTVTRNVPNQNLTPYGGPQNGSVADAGLQEFQISTGRLIRTWDALNPGGEPNIPPSAGERTPEDPYHLNSVQVLPDGDVLVSMRNAWAVYLIDPVTNKILWTLGGKDSSFTLGPGASFAYQHDARLLDPGQGGQGPDVELTLFNNDNRTSATPSDGMVLSLNTITDRATLVRAYRHYPPLSAAVMGSMQQLPTGGALVGWGSEPFLSEYSKSGRELLDVRWPGAEVSYRALLTNSWVGRPYYPPVGATRGRTVYASWNGATNVAKWEVLAGSTAGKLAAVGTRRSVGFETAIKLSRAYGVYEVRALSGTGQVLRTSRPFS
jgi:arylsulfotransferase ASST